MSLSKVTMGTVTMKLTVAAPAGTGLMWVSLIFSHECRGGSGSPLQITELLATDRIQEVGNLIPTGKPEKFNG